MRILIVHPSLHIGGAETVLVTLANEWAKYCDVTFLLLFEQGILRNHLSENIKVDIIGSKRYRSAFIPIYKYIINHEFDFVLTGLFPTNIFSCILRIITNLKTKFIITQHSYYIIQDNDIKGIKKFFYPYIFRYIYRFADKIIAVSIGVEKFLISLGIDKKKVVTIFNPLKYDEIQFFSGETKDVDIVDIQSICFCGRLSDIKNISLLISAFALLRKEREINLLLIGDGPQKENLINLVSSYNLLDSVVFFGAQSNPYKYINQSSLLVLPSFSEAFPMVLLEASALGITPVATPTKGAIEIINDQYGYISPTFDNPFILANTIKMALDKPINSKKLREYAKQFSSEKIARRYINEMTSLFYNK